MAMYLGSKWLTIAMPASGNALDVDLLQSSILEPVSASPTCGPTSALILSAASAAPLSWSGSSTPVSSPWRFAVPRSVDDLMRIADAGGIMPPKSTWFEPKLRDGLLSHLIWRG